MDQKKIGNFIAVRRREAGMTQQALSERLGVSDKTVGNWENGAEPSRPFPLQASLPFGTFHRPLQSCLFLSECSSAFPAYA